MATKAEIIEVEEEILEKLESSLEKLREYARRIYKIEEKEKATLLHKHSLPRRLDKKIRKSFERIEKEEGRVKRTLQRVSKKIGNFDEPFLNRVRAFIEGIELKEKKISIEANAEEPGNQQELIDELGRFAVMLTRLENEVNLRIKKLKEAGLNIANIEVEDFLNEKKLIENPTFCVRFNPVGCSLMKSKKKAEEHKIEKNPITKARVFVTEDVNEDDGRKCTFFSFDNSHFAGLKNRYENGTISFGKYVMNLHYDIFSRRKSQGHIGYYLDGEPAGSGEREYNEEKFRKILDNYERRVK